MRKPKIILYNPKAVFFDMPLALLAIAAYIDESKYEVIIVDGRIDDNASDTIRTHLTDAICFGTTVLTGKPIKDAIEKTRFVKQHKPDICTVWGGWHTSLFPTQTLEDEPTIDISVQGQGELTFKEIITAISEGTSFEDVRGLCFRSNGEIKRNTGRALEDMNTLPRVNYDLINVEDYFEKKGRRQFDFISSTGCYFRCTFCADPFVFGRNFTALDAERMGEDIAYYHKKYKFTELNFQDETLFTYSERIIGLCNELLKRNINITWSGTMRADQSHRMSDDDFALCKKAGLKRVLIGVESGSQEMMDWLKKDIKLEHVYESAHRCKEHGVEVIFPFIVGFPKESTESLAATVKVVKELSSLSTSFETPIFYFKPYPGSGITNDVVKEGYQLPQTLNEWSDFDYIGSSGPWVSDETYNFFERFKFYNKLAFGKKRKGLGPLQKVAKWRMKHDNFSFPFEKNLIEFIRPSQKLS